MTARQLSCYFSLRHIVIKTIDWCGFCVNDYTVLFKTWFTLLQCYFKKYQRKREYNRDIWIKRNILDY